MLCFVGQVKSVFEPNGPSGLCLSPVSVARSDQEYFYSSLDGMQVHRRVTLNIKFTGTHLYTWVGKGTGRVKCLAPEHNAITLARARTQTARSRVERTNQQATVPPSSILCYRQVLNPCTQLTATQPSRSYFSLHLLTVASLIEDQDLYKYASKGEVL